jgi:hypothetical protein
MTRAWRRVLPIVLAVVGFVVVGASGGPGVSARTLCPHPAKTKVITLQDVDTGKTVCARRGAVISVYLHAPPNEDRWQPILASNGHVLVVKPSGRLALPIGVTGAVYQVVARGRASLSSSRPPCLPPARVGCDAAHSWSARVVTR